MGSESYILGFLAGTLSILSPCVLPLLPIVFGAAAGKHRLGPLALAAGLTVSFVAVGLFIATIGFSIGLQGQTIRMASGLMLAAVGAVLLVPAFGARFAAAAGPVSAFMERRFGIPANAGASGVQGQFFVGALLGAIWSPCVGPTLGAASLLASRGESLGQVSLVMTAFGFGAAIPLALIGSASHKTLSRWRGRFLQAGMAGKIALGGLLVVIGLAVATGADKILEAWLVQVSPEWLTRLTTSL
mgnify:CR=1 FL=1